MHEDDEDEMPPDIEFNGANQTEAAEQAHDHLRTAYSELTKAMKTVDGGDEGVELTRAIYPDVGIALSVIRKDVAEIMKALRRWKARRPGEHPPGNIHHLVERAEGEPDEE